jgi:hypothetical protein
LQEHQPGLGSIVSASVLSQCLGLGCSDDVAADNNTFVDAVLAESARTRAISGSIGDAHGRPLPLSETLLQESVLAARSKGLSWIQSHEVFSRSAKQIARAPAGFAFPDKASCLTSQNKFELI